MDKLALNVLCSLVGCSVLRTMAWLASVDGPLPLRDGSLSPVRVPSLLLHPGSCSRLGLKEQVMSHWQKAGEISTQKKEAEETLLLPFPHWFRVRGYLPREMLIPLSCSTALRQQPTLSQIQQVKSYDEGKEAWDLEASS